MGGPYLVWIGPKPLASKPAAAGRTSTRLLGPDSSAGLPVLGSRPARVLRPTLRTPGRPARLVWPPGLVRAVL